MGGFEHLAALHTLGSAGHLLMLAAKIGMDGLGPTPIGVPSVWLRCMAAAFASGGAFGLIGVALPVAAIGAERFHASTSLRGRLCDLRPIPDNGRARAA